MSDRLVEPLYNPYYFPEFNPPYPSRTFDDVMYAVSGRNRAENHLITIARDEFFLCPRTDERIAARLVGYPLCFDRFGPLCDISLHIGT
jgi:hypothetical protein